MLREGVGYDASGDGTVWPFNAAVEQSRDWHIQGFCDLCKATRTDTIFTFLVFLNLLKREADARLDILRPCGAP